MGMSNELGGELITSRRTGRVGHIGFNVSGRRQVLRGRPGAEKRKPNFLKRKEVENDMNATDERDLVELANNILSYFC